jgi:hypothetical protein
MILVTATAFILFWYRDYLVLRMGPPRRVFRRLWIYSVFVSLAATFLWISVKRMESVEFLNFIRSPYLLISLLVFHLAAGLICFWLRRKDRHDLVWIVAIVPAPAAWILLAETVLANDAVSERAKGSVLFAVAALWVFLMVLAILRARRMEMPIESLDFVVDLAGWINWFGAGLVVLAISSEAFESFGTALRVLSAQ